MNTARTLLLATLVALLTLAAPARGAVPRDFFGVMADGPLLGPEADLERETRLMRGAGVASMRVAFYWRDMQPDPNQAIDFSGTDRIVAAAARAGVRVLPILVRAPAWATGGDEREGAVPHSGAYALWAAAVVQRYGRDGTFWDEHPDVRELPIRRWQIWNEPDIDRYWVGDPWPETYVELLRAANDAIGRVDPRAEIVAAGLTNESWEDLDALYRAGARGLFDAAAIHPFSRRVSNVVKVVRLARRTMRRNGDARTPLLLTELSWSSGKGRSTFNYGWETTERGQALRVRQALTALAERRRSLRIEGVYWYTWLSPPLGDDESFSYAGLRRMRGGRPVSKPAYRAFKQTVRRLRAR